MNRVHRTRLAAPRNFDLCTGVRPGGKGDSPPGSQAQQSTWVASPPLNVKPWSSIDGRYFTSAAGTSSQTPRTPSRRQRSSDAVSAASKSSVSLTITVMPPYASRGDSSKSQAAAVVPAATATTAATLHTAVELALRAAGSWPTLQRRAAARAPIRANRTACILLLTALAARRCRNKTGLALCNTLASTESLRAQPARGRAPL